MRTLIALLIATLFVALCVTLTAFTGPSRGVQIPTAAPPAFFVVRGEYNPNCCSGVPYRLDSSSTTGRFQSGGSGAGDTVEAAFSPTSVSANLHVVMDGADTSSELGNIDVYVLGEPGTPFHLQYTYQEGDQAANQSTGAYLTSVFYQSFQDISFQVAPGGSNAKSASGGDVIDGTTTGQTTSFQGETYSLAWSASHWIEVGANTCCGAYSGHAEADWVVSATIGNQPTPSPSVSPTPTTTPTPTPTPTPAPTPSVTPTPTPPCDLPNGETSIPADLPGLTGFFEAKLNLSPPNPSVSFAGRLVTENTPIADIDESGDQCWLMFPQAGMTGIPKWRTVQPAGPASIGINDSWIDEIGRTELQVEFYTVALLTLDPTGNTSCAGRVKQRVYIDCPTGGQQLYATNFQTETVSPPRQGEPARVVIGRCSEEEFNSNGQDCPSQRKITKDFSPTSGGSPVNVQLGNVGVIFPTVATAGITTASPIDPYAQGAPPVGDNIIGPADDIATTATYSGPVSVCFNLSSITDPNVFSHLKVLHSENGTLIDRTVGQDFSSHTVCASVNSLSPFVIAQGIAPTAAPATISGTVTTQDGAPVAGVMMTLIGAQSRFTVTDSQGRYSFGNVEIANFYTVTPALANYTFAPSNRSFSLLANETDAVFTAIPDAVPSLNPLDTSGFFVRQQYVDFLGREPDEAGFDFWYNNIENCGADANCRAVQRINTSAAFFLSIEFQQTGYLVYRTYQASYGEMPNAPVPLRLSEFKPDTAEIGNGVVVNQSGWETVLDNNKQAYMSEFVQRARFVSAYPVSMSPSAFVDKLFQNAGVMPPANDRADAIKEFGSAGTSADLAARGRALRRVAENSVLAQQQLNQAFVLMEYFGYLRRDPNVGQDVDYSGYNFWLTKLNQFNGNFQNAEMVKAFIFSSEYRQRFGP